MRQTRHVLSPASRRDASPCERKEGSRTLAGATAPLLPLLAAFFLSQAGCFSEDRPRFYTYCDDTGCYSCDERGCGALAGRPPGGVCAKATDCAPGCFCGPDGKCAEAGFCDKAADCPSGYSCNSARHSCEPGSGGGGEVKPQACKVATDCAAAGECVDGTCKPTPNLPNACVSSRQCGAGGVCQDGRCQRACTDDSSCGAGRACTAGRCVPRAPQAGDCTTSAQCGAAQVCINSTCYASCSKDGDCAAVAGKNICLEGLCRADERRVPECAKNADCAAGTECVDALCRTFCFASSDCAACADGPVCSGGYCMTAREASPQCRTATECGGAHCTDGACGQ